MEIIIEQLEYTTGENIAISEMEEIEVQFEVNTVTSLNSDLSKTISCYYVYYFRMQKTKERMKLQPVKSPLKKNSNTYPLENLTLGYTFRASEVRCDIYFMCMSYRLCILGITRVSRELHHADISRV